MKIVITEFHLQKIIKEIGVSDHVNLRLGQRLIDQNFYDVVAFSRKNLDKIVIGKYEIPQEAITNANNVLNKLNDPDYAIPLDISLVIQLYEFKLNLQNIILLGTPQQQAKYKYIFNDKNNWNIYVRTSPKGDEKISYGRFLVCVSRNNKIKTTFLLADTNRSFNKLKEHMWQKPEFKNVNEIIYISNPETQLDAYIDVDRLRSNQSKEPQTPIEQQNPKHKPKNHR
jgi:hypothetical protein